MKSHGCNETGTRIAALRTESTKSGLKDHISNEYRSKDYPQGGALIQKKVEEDLLHTNQQDHFE